MAEPLPYGTRRGRLILWLWKHLPMNGRTRILIAWLGNLRYAVGVAAVVLNDKDEVLLLRHTYRRETYAWGLPGGWVKGRESLERALARELWEETGFTIGIERLIAVHSGFALPRLTVIYLARIVGGSFRPSDEVSEYRFLPAGELGHILRAEQAAVWQALGIGPKAN